MYWYSYFNTNVVLCDVPDDNIEVVNSWVLGMGANEADLILYAGGFTFQEIDEFLHWSVENS